MDNKVHICHHSDLDGYSAAYVAKRYCDSCMIPAEFVKFHEMDYDTLFPFTEIAEEDVVIIVDFSLHTKIMQQLLEKTPNVIWIDHHISAIKSYDTHDYDMSKTVVSILSNMEMTEVENDIFSPYGYEDEYVKPYEVVFSPYKNGDTLAGFRSTKFCGAVNAWIYFNIIGQIAAKYHAHTTYVGDVRNCFMYPKIIEDPIEFTADDIYVPYMLELVNDWDLFIKKSEQSSYLNTYFGAHKDVMHPTSNTWNTMWNDSHYIAHLCKDGAIMETYKKKSWERIALLGVYPTEIDGIPALACNCPNANSDLFNSVKNIDEFKDLKILILFSRLGTKDWRYQLYSDEVDVSEICKRHGGGGHRGAAGFFSDDLIV